MPRTYKITATLLNGYDYAMGIADYEMRQNRFHELFNKIYTPSQAATDGNVFEDRVREKLEFGYKSKDYPELLKDSIKADTLTNEQYRTVLNQLKLGGEWQCWKSNYLMADKTGDRFRIYGKLDYLQNKEKVIVDLKTTGSYVKAHYTESNQHTIYQYLCGPDYSFKYVIWDWKTNALKPVIEIPPIPKAEAEYKIKNKIRELFMFLAKEPAFSKAFVKNYSELA